MFMLNLKWKFYYALICKFGKCTKLVIYCAFYNLNKMFLYPMIYLEIFFFLLNLIFHIYVGNTYEDYFQFLLILCICVVVM